MLDCLWDNPAAQAAFLATCLGIIALAGWAIFDL